MHERNERGLDFFLKIFLLRGRKYFNVYMIKTAEFLKNTENQEGNSVFRVSNGALYIIKYQFS